MTDYTPPHPRWVLDKARDAVVTAARAFTTGGSFGRLHSALAQLDRLEADNHEHAERQRLANLATTIHLTGMPGHRVTLCGVNVRDVPNGWAKHRAAWHGQTVCAQCDERANVLEQAGELDLGPDDFVPRPAKDR